MTKYECVKINSVFFRSTAQSSRLVNDNSCVKVLIKEGKENKVKYGRVLFFLVLESQSSVITSVAKIEFFREVPSHLLDPFNLHVVDERPDNSMNPWIYTSSILPLNLIYVKPLRLRDGLQPHHKFVVEFLKFL